MILFLQVIDKIASKFYTNLMNIYDKKFVQEVILQHIGRKSFKQDTWMIFLFSYIIRLSL